MFLVYNTRKIQPPSILHTNDDAIKKKSKQQIFQKISLRQTERYPGSRQFSTMELDERRASV